MTWWVSREVGIAHLELHGWVPVVNKATGRFGIYHEGIGLGFSVRNDAHRDPAGDSSVKRWDRSHMKDSYEVCEWDDVTDWHLKAINDRLGEV